MSELPIRDCTVSELLRRAVRAFPGREAVVAPQRRVRWTFADLDARADEVAAAVVHAGLAPGDRAVVWAKNVPEWIALQYGLARTGVVLATANTALKKDEISYILKKSRARALFFGAGARDNDFQATVAALDRAALPRLELLVGVDGAVAPGTVSYADFLAAARPADRERAARVERGLDRDDVINMQYTSGTTGFPKGVMLSHRNLVQNAAAIAPRLGYVPGDRLCLCVPMFHCFGCVIGTLVSHANGVAMVMIDLFDPDVVLDTIQAERCTAIYGVPTMFVAELQAQRERRRDLSSLQVGVMAGAPCPEKLVREVSAELPLPGLTIAYGLTEASPGVTLSRRGDSLDLRATTVGRALDGIEVKVFDPTTKKEVPRGERGELWTRGEHVMKGYDDDADATRASITPDGWLRTGDLAVELPDGSFKIVGRIKEMIIRGGENIYPAEVEDALRRHEGVLDVAVFGIPSEFFGEEVAAAVRLRAGRPGTEATARELEDFLRARIAHHKVPSRFLFVDAFPLTGSGKIQRFKLRESLLRLL